MRSARLKVRAPLSRILLWAEDGAAGGAGACGGDSGAPLFLADGETVAAIVAWTSGAERGKRCGGLTQGPLIAPQRDWIEATLARWALGPGVTSRTRTPSGARRAAAGWAI